MSFPKELKYTRDHEWISAEAGTAKVGISSYAVEQLGDIVHVELPKEGQQFAKGDAFATVESTKTVSDVYLPAGGKIVKVNRALCENPEKLQDNPYEEWLVEIAITESSSGLFTAQAYEAFLTEDHHE